MLQLASLACSEVHCAAAPVVSCGMLSLWPLLCPGSCIQLAAARSQVLLNTLAG